MCPVCGEPMLILELDAVEVDHCARCGGTWLDAGELERIAGAAGADPGALSRALAEARRGNRGRRRCPRCGKRMRRVDVGGVELDSCPRGHGLWLDRGEMEQVISSFSEGEEGSVARFLADLYGADRTDRTEGE